MANLRLHTSSVSFVGSTVLLHLPVSKMDIGGKGAVRTHRCCCPHAHDTPPEPIPGGQGQLVTDFRSVCVVCMLKQQVKDMTEFYGFGPTDPRAARDDF